MDRRDVLSAATSVLTVSAVAGCLRASDQVDDSDETTEAGTSTTSSRPDETAGTTEQSVDAELRWQSNVDAISGAIGSERVFLQTETSVVTLSRDGGDVVWEYDQFGESKALTDPVAGPGWVAVGNTSPDETGTIYKLDAASGEVVDEVDVDSAFEGQTFAASGVGVFTLTTFDHEDRVRSMAHGVVAVDLESMELLWRTDEGFSGVVDAGDELVVGAHDEIRGRDPQTGSVNWTLETDPVYTFELMDGVVYWASLQNVYEQELPPSESELLFSAGADLEAGVSVADGYVVCGLREGVMVVDGSGEVQWSQSGLTLHDLVVADGVVWAAGEELLGVELDSWEQVRRFDPSTFASFDVTPVRVNWVEARDGLVLAADGGSGVFVVEVTQ